MRFSRFEIYTSPDIAGKIIDISKSFEIDAKVVGRCDQFNGKKLTIKSEFGEFVY